MPEQPWGKLPAIDPRLQGSRPKEQTKQPPEVEQDSPREEAKMEISMERTAGKGEYDKQNAGLIKMVKYKRMDKEGEGQWEA